MELERQRALASLVSLVSLEVDYFGKQDLATKDTKQINSNETLDFVGRYLSAAFLAHFASVLRNG
jgi:hypothetical protein